MIARKLNIEEKKNKKELLTILLKRKLIEKLREKPNSPKKKRELPRESWTKREEKLRLLIRLLRLRESELRLRRESMLLKRRRMKPGMLFKKLKKKRRRSMRLMFKLERPKNKPKEREKELNSRSTKKKRERLSTRPRKKLESQLREQDIWSMKSKRIDKRKKERPNKKPSKKRKQLMPKDTPNLLLRKLVLLKIRELPKPPFKRLIKNSKMPTKPRRKFKIESMKPRES